MTQLLASKKHNIFTEVDEGDVQRLVSYTLTIQFLRKKTPYVYLRGNDGKLIALSRFLLEAPKGLVVDHIDGNTLDNRKCNLRICTYAQNALNRRPHGQASKYRGVTWGPRQKKWRAAIQRDKKQIHLGYFKTEIEAALAFDERAKVLHGEFARLNFPNAA